MAVHLWLNEQAQFFDSNGDPASGYLLFFYAAGGAVKEATYTTSAGTVPNANPMVLDAAGRLAQAVWLTSGVLYKVGLAVSTETDPPSNFVTPWPLDNVSGINDFPTSAVTGEFIPLTSSGIVVVPTYISATSFSVPGNQTAIFTPGRALQIVDAGGTKYGFVKTSTFGAGITTIVLDQNSAALANPVSSVAYGIINSGVNSSNPILPDTVPLRGGSADESKQVRLELDGLSTATTRVLTVQDRDGTVTLAGNTPKYISGFTFANNAGDAANDLDVFSGSCMDSGGTYWIGPLSLGFFTKQSDVAWQAGNSFGGLDTGVVGNSDYYIWAIARVDTHVTDILFSTSSTAPTMPANYTVRRLIGWFKRVGGAIVAFTTYETAGGGIELLWTSPTLDIDLAATLTTTRRTDSVKTPQNLSTIAEINVNINDAGSNSINWIYCPDLADLAPSGTVTPLFNMATYSGSILSNGMTMRVRTDITGKIAARSTLATVDNYRVVTLGFTWSRR